MDQRGLKLFNFYLKRFLIYILISITGSGRIRHTLKIIHQYFWDVYKGRRRGGGIRGSSNIPEFVAPKINSFEILISLAQNHERLIFEYWLAPSWFFLDLKSEKHNFFVIFPQTRPFFWGKGWRNFHLFVLKLCCSRNYYYDTITKKISFYHISNGFLQFSKRWSKNTKKVQLFNFVSCHWLKKKSNENWQTESLQKFDSWPFFVFLDHLLEKCKKSLLIC